MAQSLTKLYSKTSTENAPTLTEEMIELNINNLDRVLATVRCAFCEKKIHIHLKRSNSSGGWVLSNLKKHLVSCKGQEHQENINREVKNKSISKIDISADSTTMDENENTNVLLKLKIEPATSTLDEAKVLNVLKKYSKQLRMMSSQET